jgi:hypothetical protein
MREFFRGWRRKGGCVTPVIACVLLGLWVRSLVIRDEIRLRPNRWLHAFASAAGTLRWGTFGPLPAVTDGNDRLFEYTTKNVSDQDNNDVYWQQWRNEWRYGWAGFDFGAGYHWTRSDVTISRWTAPHWAIILPLTLLSAWQLLSKPKPKAKLVAPEIASNQG